MCLVDDSLSLLVASFSLVEVANGTGVLGRLSLLSLGSLVPTDAELGGGALVGGFSGRGLGAEGLLL